MPHSFGAFKNRNFSLFWVGMLISMIGTWIQITAQSWLVYKLTKSAFMLGLVSAAAFAPFFIFALIGGNFADKFDKRKLLYITQSAMAIFAFTLWILTKTGIINVWYLIIISLLAGIANAFDMPARQAFVYEIVGKEEIMNAVSMNSILFNAAQIVGPAIAGMIVASLGISWCFLINSISFVAVIVALRLMILKPQEIRLYKNNVSALQNIKEGLKFTWQNQTLKTIIFITALTAVFASPLGVLMPVFAKEIFKVDAKGFGVLMTCSGIGALIGGLGIAAFGGVKKKGMVFFSAAIVLSIFMAIFSASKLFIFSSILLVVIGLCQVVQISISNTLVQLTTTNEMRGRVMSIYSIAFMGLSPIGSIMSGSLAQIFGAPLTVTLNAAILGFGIFFIYRTNDQLKQL